MASPVPVLKGFPENSVQLAFIAKENLNASEV